MVKNGHVYEVGKDSKFKLASLLQTYKILRPEASIFLRFNLVGATASCKAPATASNSNLDFPKLNLEVVVRRVLLGEGYLYRMFSLLRLQK